jgi:hypothetical protein
MAKRVETRSWPLKHRGPLLIQAAKIWRSDLWEACQAEPFHSALCHLGFPRQIGKPDRGLPFGCIVGRVDVVECYPTEMVRFDDSGLDVTPRFPVDQVRDGKLRLWPDPERAFGDYRPGRFAILCRDAVAFKRPIPCRGRQGLFEVPDDILAAGGVS